MCVVGRKEMLFWVSDFPQSSTNDAKLKQVSPKHSPEEDVSFGGTLDIGRLRESEERGRGHMRNSMSFP